jgi:hypothetical protein
LSFDLTGFCDAVWLPTETDEIDVISRRVGNYQYHIAIGPLVDQLWVR